MWNILVVDDDFANRKLLIEFLGGSAHCDAAASGTEALAAYSLSIEGGKAYDAILLDVAMPDMDGIEVLKKIRSMEEARHIPLGKGIPIIMVTAYKTSFMKSFISGCDDFILKPIDRAKLLTKLTDKVKIPSDVQS